MDTNNHGAASDAAPLNTAVSTLEADPETGYSRLQEQANETARRIAVDALAASGGRATYSWEGNGIRLTYLGDNPDGTLGETERLYWYDDAWQTQSRERSESGTGLLNLQLEHVKGCDDPVVNAKRELIWLLSDPELDIVGYTIATHSGKWNNLRGAGGNLLHALRLRLAEVLEQKVLENPHAGLDLREIAEGTNLVGWIVRTLDGAIFNTMRRISHNESDLTEWDAERSDGMLQGRLQSDLGEHQLGAAAESDSIARHDEARALALGEYRIEQSSGMREQERKTLNALLLLQQFDLPYITVPAVPERKQLLAELSENPDLARESLLVHFSLITGTPFSGDGDGVSHAWRSLWARYDEDAARALLEKSSRRERRGLVAMIVEGSIGFPEPMGVAMKKRLVSALQSLVDDEEWGALSEAAADAFDRMQSLGDRDGWEQAANAAVAYPLSPFSDASALERALLKAAEKSG